MPHLRIQRRIDLVLVTLLCVITTGCLIRARSEPKPDVKRVAYLGIKNATPRLDQAVSDRVDPGYERVSAEAYRETARKLNAEGMIDLDVARVAQALDVDVVIHGEYVRKNRRRGQLIVTMRTAAIGAVVGEYVIPVRRGAMTRRGARRLDGELRAELEALLGPPPAPPAEPAGAVADTEAATEPAAGTREASKEEEPGRGDARPAAAEEPGRGAKPTAQSTREPAEGQPDEARSKPAPGAPAPVIRQDESGQVIDEEMPPPPR